MKKVKRGEEKNYYKCPACHENDDNFYMKKTKNEDFHYGCCSICRLKFFSPIKKEYEVLNWIDYWHKNGDGLIRKPDYRYKNFKPVLKKIACPCCLKNDFTVLNECKNENYFYLRCLLKKCSFNSYVPVDYLYVFSKY